MAEAKHDPTLLRLDSLAREVAVDRQEAPSACPGCGAVALGGAAGCQARYDDLRGFADGDDSFRPFTRVVHDTYCVQHPARYIGHRPKALAAHLGGLGWAVEGGGHPTGYRALQRWLAGVRWHTVPMPELPAYRGGVTVASVCGVVKETADPKLFGHEVERWARSAWEAYAILHPLARGWIEEALTARGGHRRTPRSN